MHTARAVMEGTDAPVAQSDSWMSLYRRESSEKPRRKRDYKLLRRQEEDDAEDEEEESASDSEDSDGSDSSGEEGESSSSSSEGSGDEEEVVQAQQRLQQSSPYADFELPSVPDLGALPMPPMNTRRSMQLDRIKRRPRGSPSRRQLPPPPPPPDSPPPPPGSLPPPPPELSSGSSESDGISSESEDETSTSSGNPPPSSPPPSPALPLPPPPLAPVSEEPPSQTTASSSSSGSSGSSSSSSSSSSSTSSSLSGSATTTSRRLAPPVSRSSTDIAFSATSSTSSSSGSSTGTITSSPTSTETSSSLGQSTFIAAADSTGFPSTLPTDSNATTSSQQKAGPAPESQTALIAGVTILGIAIMVAVAFLIFRFCLPVRTWYTTRLQKHRDEKAARLGTAPSAWNWPLQFIFGSDRPAPPRRQQQQQQQQHQEYYKNPISYASNSDLESQSVPGLVADGFRPQQGNNAHPPQYKSYTTASGGSWVANGWRAPLSQISQRLSNWPRRSGTARWFFGGGASRWSDSDAGDSNPRTTAYSEGQIVDMYGAPTPRSVEKSPFQIQVSQVRDTTPSPPLPQHSNIALAAPSPRIITTSIIKPPTPALTAAGLGLGLTSTLATQSQTPIRPRASPRVSYLRSSVATTATSGTGYTAIEPPLPPALPFGGAGGFSHFSASTVDATTPRRFVSEGFPPPLPLPSSPAPVGTTGMTVGVGMPLGLPRGPKPAAGRFPVRTASVSSSRSAASVSSRGSVGSVDREKPLPRPAGL